MDVAASTLTFIDVGVKFAGFCWEVIQLYRSKDGLSRDYVELESRIKDMQYLRSRISPDGSNESCRCSENRKAIVRLSGEILAVAEEGRARLNTFKPRWNSKTDRGWRVLKSLREKPEMLNIEERLNKLQRDLQFHLIQETNDYTSGIPWIVNRLEQDSYSVVNGAELIGLWESVSDSFNFVKSARDEYEIQCSLKSIETKSEQLANRITLGQTQNAISRKLAFPEILARFSSVERTHAGTFDWIFSSSHEFEPLHFAEWLEFGQRTYTIVGKAGCGKSTLMKSIWYNESTHILLGKWSGTDTLVTGEFFFWYSGSDLQNSQEGLLRSLLLKIHKTCPEILPKILKEKGFGTSSEELENIVWTLPVLEDIFDKLKHVHTSSTKFCFFIDGLDEFKGPNKELFDTISSLISWPNLKLCLSTRPRPQFEPLKREAKYYLELHDHTKKDIRKYIRGKLESDEEFKKLMRNNEAHCRLIIDELIGRADGVFLWVSLVIKSLRNNLGNGETAFELLARVRELPTDMEDFLHLSLDRNFRKYQASTSTVLLMCLHTQGPIFLAMLCIATDQTPYSRESVDDFQARSSRRIDARCADFVTTRNFRGINLEEVKFAHRIIYDFLSMPKVLEKLHSQLPINFNIWGTLFRSHIALCEWFARIDYYQNNSIMSYIKRLVFIYAHNAEQDLKITLDYKTFTCMKHLNKRDGTAVHAMSESLRRNNTHEELLSNSSDCESWVGVFHLSVQYGVPSMVRTFLKMGLEFDERLLVVALFGAQESIGGVTTYRHLLILEMLLETGIDPNKRSIDVHGVVGLSAWQHLQLIINRRTLYGTFPGHKKQRLLLIEAIRLYVTHGAVLPTGLQEHLNTGEISDVCETMYDLLASRKLTGGYTI